jgi:hypothetical protein
MMINEKECCNTSSTSFETWGDFMNEDANEWMMLTGKISES